MVDPSQLERIASIVPMRKVRIYELDGGRGSWPYWFCEPCKDWKVKRGFAVKAEKVPPHALACDRCGVAG